MHRRATILLAAFCFVTHGAPARAMPGVGKMISEVAERVLCLGGAEVAERAVGRTATEAGEAGVRAGSRAMARGMAAIEAKAGAQSARLADAFGSQVAGELAERAPASDLRRLLVYAEHADSALAKDLLAKAYKEEGASLFSRIGPGHVLAGGLSAAAIVGVHRGTAPLVAVARSIDESPELASDAARLSVWWFWGLLTAVVILLLWRHGQMPWHRISGRPAVVEGISADVRIDEKIAQPATGTPPAIPTAPAGRSLGT